VATAKKDAIALLKADHRKVEGLFEDFEKARKADRKSGLAQEICQELTIHTIIEEEIFYPACLGAVKEDLLNEAHVEHDGAKVLIAEIEAGSPDDEFFDAKVKVLSEQIKHHVHEEEMRAEGLFTQARAAGLDMAVLAESMERRKQQLMKEFKVSGLPTPETRSFSGIKLKRGAPVSEARAAE
jgi:hypothetical protein